MKYLGVIAAPGKRSLSPVFQQAALDALQLDIVYEAWPTPPDGLPTRIRGMQSADVLGANVTIPHKEAVIPLLDELEDTAGRTGAVNTIVKHEGKLSGYNTDVEGFLRALRKDGGFEPSGCRALRYSECREPNPWPDLTSRTARGLRPDQRPVIHAQLPGSNRLGEVPFRAGQQRVQPLRERPEQVDGLRAQARLDARGNEPPGEGR